MARRVTQADVAARAVSAMQEAQAECRWLAGHLHQCVREGGAASNSALMLAIAHPGWWADNYEQAATTANASFINPLAPQSVISATSVAAATTIPAAKPAPVAITPATVAAAPSDGSTASAAATSTIEVKDAVSLGLLSPCWLGLGPKVDIAFSQLGPPRFFS